MEKPFLQLEDGDSFITLEQFLDLPEDSCYSHDRKWEVRLAGGEWLYRYNLAKKMWDKYGNSPPMFKDVKVLVNGHGTSFPFISRDRDLQRLPKRILTPVPESDPSYNYSYFLERNGILGNDTKYRSLLDKYFWWRAIYIED